LIISDSTFLYDVSLKRLWLYFVY